MSLATLGLVAASATGAAGASSPVVKNGDLVFAEGLYGMVTQAPGPSNQPTSLGEGRQPKYSPDGRQLAYLDGDVHVRTLASGVDRQVTHTGTTVGDYLAWSPDAKSLVVSSGNQLRKVVVSTGAVSTLYNASAPVKQPAWSPDGTRIAFSTGDAIKLVKPDGTAVRTVFSGGSNTMPDWRPDSKALAFITTRFTGASEMVTLPRSGAGSPTRVSHLAYPQGLHHLQVVWSPDGKKLAVLQFNANHEPNDQDTDERFKVRGYLPDGSHSYSLTGPIYGDDGPEGLDWAPKVTN
jgi:dipeptidyl aminopeptidase/acylaminoacyl peptidase